MASEGAYALRRADEAESFRNAWCAAQSHGIQRLTDIAIDRAIEGVPVPVFHKGEQVGEKRWYNDRLLMFLLKHHLPGHYGTPPLNPGTRHPETIAREAAENCPVCKQRAEEAGDEEPEYDDAAMEEAEQWLDDILDRYEAKVRAERRHRLNGEIVAADFVLRQLTHIELILDCGGRTQEMIELWTNETGDTPGMPVPVNASPASRILDQIRRQAWAKAGEPDRPPLRLGHECGDTHLEGSPNWEERLKARRACEARIAEAQREWEAAGREDSWEEWKRGAAE